MKRLRENASSPDPVVARAASLVAAMKPLDTSRMRRRPPPKDAKPRSKIVHLRVGFMVVAMLASAAASAATLRGVGWLRGSSTPTSGSHVPSRAAASVQPPAHPEALPSVVVAQSVHEPAPAPIPAPRELAAPTAPSVPALAAPTAASALIVTGPAATHATAPTSARAASTDSPNGAPTGDESALVVDAVRALRRDHDAKRAWELAQEALQRYPRGAQVEEATAVAMEAAFVRGDHATAHVWAQRYLDTFGTGRFADRARQMLQRSPR
jgi:hypothetical protein